MKLIVMWLWGAGLASSLWVLTVFPAAPLVILAAAGVITTAVAFGIYLYNNWGKEE